MKLQVQSYNNGGAAYNAETEETKIISYKITHRLGSPAEAEIKISDATGTMAQKYNDDANDVYLGVGKVTIEDPDATDIFYGRIIRATADTDARTLTLYCEDWLSQLNEEQITYDMREDLDGAGLRQSVAHADPDATPEPYIDVAVNNIYSAQSDDGGSITDETIAANELTTNDMTLLPAVPAVGDAYYFGFDSKVSGFSLYISQQGDWAGTTFWTYWDGGAWAGVVNLTPVDDASRRFNVAGLVTYGWTVQGDWATTAVNGVTAYYVRCIVLATTGVTTQPKGRNAYDNQY